MIAFLIKASVVIGATWLFYKIFLQKESFFAINRFFLLASLLMAFLIPFLNVPQLIDHQGLFNDLLIRIGLLDEASMNADAFSSQFLGEAETIYGESDMAGNPPLLEEKSFNGFTLLITTYLIGLLILGGHFLYQLGSLFVYIQRAKEKYHESGAVIIHADNNLAPCSFFNYIFINPLHYEKGTYEQILAHEKIHTQYGHSYDLVLSKLAAIVLWFNPFIWLFKREVEKNIEYQTDFLMLADTRHNMEAYQMSLLQVASPHTSISITTNYNQSLLTQRIMMMKAEKSPTVRLWKYSFLIPFFLGILLVLNEPIKLSAQVHESQVFSSPEAIKSYKKFYIVINADTKPKLLSNIKRSLEKYGVTFEYDSLKIEKGKIFAIQTKINAPGSYAASASFNDLGRPLIGPLVYYDEMKVGGGSGAGGISDSMSEYGKQIVIDNLNGLLIIDDKGKMHVRGAVNLP